MNLQTFELERQQSLWENQVDCNLTESGLHPYALADVLSVDELEALARLPLGYGHTDGDPTLKARIAALYPGATADNVLITNGSAEANFVAMWALLEPDDEVVYMVPNYMQIDGIARALGARVRAWPLRPSTGWMPDLDELRTLMNDHTRAIVICNPNNPTGAVMPSSMLDEIGAVADRYGCCVHSDEIYRGSELTGAEGDSMAGRAETTVVVSGLSKALGFPGLRIGWVVGPEERVAECWRRHDYTSISTGMVSQFAASRILAPENRERFLQRGRDHLRTNLKIVQDWVAEFDNRLTLTPPSAGGMAFVGYEGNMASQTLVDTLREECDVFLVAGSWFGMEGYLRIGFGVETETLRTGLDRIRPTLRRLLDTGA